jgi:hypothetical protein
VVEIHHPLRETIMLQTGVDAEARASFLRAHQRIALTRQLLASSPKIRLSTSAIHCRFAPILVSHPAWLTSWKRT